MSSAELSDKLSRRQFAKIAVGSSIAASAAVASPQTHKEPVHHSGDTEWRRRALEAVAKFDIPMATEPGFVFRP
jgi:hypothetical protein